MIAYDEATVYGNRDSYEGIAELAGLPGVAAATLQDRQPSITELSIESRIDMKSSVFRNQVIRNAVASR